MIVKSLCGEVSTLARQRKMAATLIYRVAKKKSPYDMTEYIDDWVGLLHRGTERTEVPT
jgi:hypothetical protein